MQAQPKSTNTYPEWHFHPWANQLGGLLVAQYTHELYRSAETRVKPDPDHLFQRTKEIFLNGGLDELEHLQFRETKLKKLCLDKLWEMTRERNPSHPRFQPEPDPDTENYDWSEPPLIEPQISRELLEAEIASWYVRGRLKTHKKGTEPLHKSKTELNNSPASPRHEGKADASRSQSPAHRSNPITTNTLRREHWRLIQESDLEGPELDTEQICKEIHTALRDKGTTHETTQSIRESLSQAQQKASRAHKNAKIALPLRLRKSSSLLFDRYALTKIGTAGRGNSSKYRRIQNIKSPS